MGRRAERRREAARLAAEDERARQVQRQEVLADHLPRHLREEHGREDAEAGGDPGGGSTLSGPEAVNISGQAIGRAAAEPREPDTAPAWATRALGPVPEDPAARSDWQDRASAVAAYREMHGYDNPADPIGPAPGKTSPEARAAWQGALAALGAVDGMDLRHPRRPRAADREADGGGWGEPLIQITGRGPINIVDSVIGGKHVTEYQAGPGDPPKAPEADEEREAG